MEFRGVIIEESLADKSVLQRVHIESTEVVPVTEKHRTPWVKQWTIHTVTVPEQAAAAVAERLSAALDPQHPWYADFNSDLTHYIVYRGRVFRVDRADRLQYAAARDYGIRLGIPSYQVNFVKDITAQPWFHRTRYGLYLPTGRYGWTMAACYLLFIVLSLWDFYRRSHSVTATLISFAPFFAIVTILYVFISYRKSSR